MENQEYMDNLFRDIKYLTDAFCNGCEKCKTNEEAFEFLDEFYRENIIAEMDYLPYEEDDPEFNDNVLLEAERYMISMIERVIAHPHSQWLNKKCVRFLRYFAKKKNEDLFSNEYERVNWEFDNMWLGI